MNVLKHGLLASMLLAANCVFAIEVEIADDLWDGKIVPAGQQCNRFGGNASTPIFNVTDIPEGADLAIISISDIDSDQMSNGGHGVLSYDISGMSSDVAIPAIKGHTFSLPEGVSSIAAHKASGWDTAGAYLPPCSGGGGHNYEVKIGLYEIAEGRLQFIEEAVVSLGRY